ncbi:hypothetical protein AZE42_05743 [Rhizopogon vesiculosus]|uniref:Fe2OG dioxygenase domain-containing protein n=1 Tax=Rhizopogon vesiculosus TaxID=180088 RepID=A0A1J8PR82_9AGAM|nr:hypothetical protein AZE42_05743 [Rhizopogon vesiculosus]
MTFLTSVPHYDVAPPTKATPEYADLAVIDMSKADTEEGRAALTIEVRDALFSHGFVYVVNHGYSQAQTARMFDIADVPFSAVDDSEQQIYAGTMQQTGSSQGYKFRKYWHIGAGVRDQIEIYSISRDVTKRGHPEALRPLLQEIQELIARSLELPEDTLVNIHNYDVVDETTVRFLKYHPRTEEEEIKTKNVWLKEHRVPPQDFGSLTILWSQPIAALQIQTREGEWRWIHHLENALVVSIGDSIEFLTGGYYKATVHRVVQPPEDQRNYTRRGVFYFALPNDHVKLVPMAESPVLQRVGIQRRWETDEARTVEQWRMSRISVYGQSELKSGKEKGVEEGKLTG